MDWRWFVPIWGLFVVIDDYVHDWASDYMVNRLPFIFFYQIIVFAGIILLSVYIVFGAG